MPITTPQEMVAGIDKLGNSLALLLSDPTSLQSIRELFPNTAAGYNPNTSALKLMGACLISFGEDINPKDNKGGTPLHYAARNNSNVEALRYLVSQHADVYATDNDGKTPLDYADTEEKKRILREARTRQTIAGNGIACFS